MRIGQPAAFAFQFTDQPVGIRKHADKPEWEIQFRRQSFGHKGGKTALRH